MNHLTHSYTIKGTPKRYLVDCLMAYKKSVLLEIAGNQSIPIKKREIKKAIAVESAEHIIKRFDENFLSLNDDEKKALASYVKEDNLENKSIQETTQLSLLSKGYVYFFVENQQIKPIVPEELADKLVHGKIKAVKDESSATAQWFLKTHQAVKEIHSECTLAHLTKSWNKHATEPLSTKEVEKFFD